MRYGLLWMTLLWLCVTGVKAQDNSTQARKILDKTAAVVGRKGGAQADFSISSGKYDKVSGTIAIKGRKFQAKTKDAIVWYDGKTQWAYMKNTEEVNVSQPNATQQAGMNPYTFIHLYRKGYNLSVKTAGGNYQVHLTAQNKKSGIPEMYILINRKTYTPVQAKLLHGKQWMTVSFSNFKARNQDDGVFVFKAKDFPNAEIIDLR